MKILNFKWSTIEVDSRMIAPESPCPCGGGLGLLRIPPYILQNVQIRTPEPFDGAIWNSDRNCP